MWAFDLERKDGWRCVIKASDKVYGEDEYDDDDEELVDEDFNTS
jgi:hypothetical protein